ncbi:MAG TPA: type II toxin-antitoxin system RelE/ParE family toxin [Chitinophagaceae bacterium]|jgi:plasmid stabilization system protein ParE
MAVEVVWAKSASMEYMQVLIYLSTEWGDTVVNDFIKKLERKIVAIVANPGIGRIAGPGKNTRSVVITPHNRLYYEVGNGAIRILAIFNTRRHPRWNRFE